MEFSSLLFFLSQPSKVHVGTGSNIFSYSLSCWHYDYYTRFKALQSIGNYPDNVFNKKFKVIYHLIQPFVILPAYDT